MATADKAKNTTQRAKGKLKEVAGRATGDDKLRAKGGFSDLATSVSDF